MDGDGQGDILVMDEDRAAFVLILHALAVLNGFTGLFAMMIVQDELNKLATGPTTF